MIFAFNCANTQFYKKQEDDKFRFYSSIDLRNSSIQNQWVEYYGIKVGLGNKRFRFGAAYHYMYRGMFSVLTNEQFFTAPTLGNYQTKQHDFSIFTELIIHETPRWELLLPLHLGIGKMNLDATKAVYIAPLEPGNQLDYFVKEEWVETAVVGLKANYRIFKWAGLTGGFGYVFAFSGDQMIQSSFSVPYYSFGLKIFFGEFGKLSKSKEYRDKYLWDPIFVKNYE